MSAYHEPVLLSESINGLDIAPDGIYVDVTYGGGGHSQAILAHLNKGKLYAFDQDIDAQINIVDDERLVFIPQNFMHLQRFLRFKGVKQVNGILADLGVSWHQFNTPERGFSIRFDEELLDMRMDAKNDLHAREILNTYTKDKLLEIFKMYGELPNATNTAKAIADARKVRAIRTVGDLKKITAAHVRGKKHKYYAQLFQALRIEVNDEFGALRALLTQSAEVLAPNGRLVIISYHSLEDKYVKNFFKKGTFDGSDYKDFYGNSLQVLKPVNKKLIVPSKEETKKNPKSTSAKMRIAEKIA